MNKMNWPKVKRRQIRAAVGLRKWRYSILGLHKKTGMWVRGIDMEQGRYAYDELEYHGYYPDMPCVCKGIVYKLT